MELVNLGNINNSGIKAAKAKILYTADILAFCFLQLAQSY